MAARLSTYMAESNAFHPARGYVMPRVPVDPAFARREVRRAAEKHDILVVIGMLRATSTIITALSNGAEKVVPAQTLAEAKNLWRENPGSLLAGERGGEKPYGFNLGNSPREFQPEVVRGKTIILTTSSGTRTILAADETPHLLLGAFLNAQAVAERALEIAQAGKRGNNPGVFRQEALLQPGGLPMRRSDSA